MMQSRSKKLLIFFTGNTLKWIALLILFFSNVHTKLYAQANADKAKAYYYSAENEYKSRNFSKAIEYCRQVEDLLGKTNARLEALRLKSYFDNGDTEKAKTSLQTFLSLDADESLIKSISPYIIKIEEAEKERARKQKEAAQEEADWNQAKRADSKDAYQHYLKTYPAGSYATSAKDEIKRIEKEAFNKTHTTCDVCNGRGTASKTVECYECYGSGKVEGSKKTCPVCHGTGKGAVTVDFLGGRKTAGCSNCHNYGWIREKVTCSVCHGRGERTITKTCTKCYGKGTILKSESAVFAIRYSTEERKAMAAKASFSEGLAAIESKSKMGYIDKAGNEAVAFIYDEAGDFKDGIALVKKNGKYGYIDQKGNERIKIEYNQLSSFDNNGLAWYVKPNTGDNRNKWPKAVGVLNKNGEMLGGFVTSNDVDRDYIQYWTAHFLIVDNVESENYRKAVFLYSIITPGNKFYKEAQLALGDIYTEGKGGITKDNTKAYTYYNNAYKNDAAFNQKQKEQFGDALYNGYGTPVNKEKALEIYTDSKYSYVAVSSLSYKYVKTAIELKQYAKAENKIAYLEKNLSKRYKDDKSLCYLKGLLAESKGDLKAAKKWYKKAKK